MSNPWFRMYAEFATDAKVQSMTEAMQRRLMMLLCLRCSNVLATLHDDELTFALRLTPDELAETKALFIRKRFIDDAWNLLNWDKRQFNSDSSTERSRKHRKGKQQLAKIELETTVAATPCNVAATVPDTDTDTEERASHLRFAPVGADESGDSPPSATGDDAAKPKRPELPASPGPQMMDLWAEILPDQQQPIDWPQHRSAAVSARWREKAAHYRWPTQDAGMAWFDRLFRYCRASEFLMGKKPPRDRSSRPFALTFDWLFAPKNFTKVIEGHFHEPAAKGSTSRPVRPAASADAGAAAS